MVAIKRMSGSWRGRMVDVLGFEGELELDLKAGRGGEIKGQYHIEIGAGHSSLQQRGDIAGTISEKGLKLALVGERLPVKISLNGDAIELRDGGVGLRGVYEVSARGYSPLQGGIVCASKDQKLGLEVATRRDSEGRG